MASARSSKRTAPWNFITSATISVNGVNDPPTISDVGNQVVAEDGTTAAIPFTVGDLETAPAALTVTGASSNVALVPNDRIVVAGAGEARTVQIQPLADQNGAATITLTVSDGTTTRADTFVLTVGGDNDPPTITAIGPQTTDEDVAKAITVNIADIDTPIASLTLGASYSPSFVSSVSFAGTGAARTMTITPVAHKTGISDSIVVALVMIAGRRRRKPARNTRRFTSAASFGRVLNCS